MSVKPAKFNLTVYKGTTFSHVFTYKTPKYVLGVWVATDGTPYLDWEGQPIDGKIPDYTIVDLSGYSARMQVRETQSAASTLLSLTTGSGIALGGALGTITITVSAATTTALTWTEGVYDLEIESAGGVVDRLLEGKIKTNPEVTR